uniref:Uncharacterized protein n=1 Tax=Cacopsylla melanoneura TaxID=428564 RepID=A0A8D8YZZ2_9HEMI
MDDEIQETVESLLGKHVKIIDCEKKSVVKEEELLLINGCPITLEGEDGEAIKNALLHGNIPNCDLLNQILIRAGILKAPVRLETNLSVKSSVVTREEVSVSKHGAIIDERSRETKEDNYYTSSSSEIWEPMKPKSSLQKESASQTNLTDIKSGSQLRLLPQTTFSSGHASHSTIPSCMQPSSSSCSSFDSSSAYSSEDQTDFVPKFRNMTLSTSTSNKNVPLCKSSTFVKSPQNTSKSSLVSNLCSAWTLISERQALGLSFVHVSSVFCYGNEIFPLLHVNQYLFVS